MDRLQELQEQVESGEWRTSSEVLNRIYNNFLEWTEQHGAGQTTNFGTPDFWDSILNGKKLLNLPPLATSNGLASV